MSIRNYRDLLVWQTSMGLCEQVYLVTQAMPPDERFGLTQQMRRAAGSIPANVAEGQARGTDADFCRFLRIAYGSLRELETFLILAERLEYIADEAVAPLLETCAEVGKLMNGLIKKLRE